MHRKRYQESLKSPNGDVRRVAEIEKQESVRQSKNLARIIEVQNKKIKQGINVVRKIKDVDYN